MYMFISVFIFVSITMSIYPLTIICVTYLNISVLCSAITITDYKV